MGGPRFTPVVALQASTMKCRDMKSKLKMEKHVKTTENGLLRAVAERMVDDEASGGVYACSWSEPCRTVKKEQINLKVNE